MAKKNVIVTPAGLTRWTCLNKPSTKFNKDGEYSVKLALPLNEAAALKATFTALAQEAKAEAVKSAKTAKEQTVIGNYALHVPGEEEINDAGQKTGFVVFNFKTKAIVRPEGKDPFDVKVGIFDAAQKPIPSNVIIGSGSRVKVAFSTFTFTNAANKQIGVGLRLAAVQVLDLKAYQTGTADSFGFGTEEGYVAEESAPEPQTTTGEATAPAGNPSGDF